MKTSNVLENNFTWEKQQHALQKIKTFQANGYLLLLSNRTKIFSRFYFEKHTPTCFSITLINFIGQTQLKTIFCKNICKILDNTGKIYVNKQPEITFSAITGLTIPLDCLNKWIVGLPEKIHRYTLKNAHIHTLQHLYKKKLLKIIYLYYNNKNVPFLPNIIKMKQGNNSIVLHINNWILE
ncbi:MAG: lipoprotein insertase outer membrane protein LolB [Buchnera aphidicola (Meitanaphis microgallis)]